jgi:micrococcal nuclease
MGKCISLLPPHRHHQPPDVSDSIRPQIRSQVRPRLDNVDDVDDITNSPPALTPRTDQDHVIANSRARFNIKHRIPPQISWDLCEDFVPPIREGRVIKVYDGDTITIASMLPYPQSPIYRFSVRLRGIDTPEMRTKDPNEKEIARKAKEALSKLVLWKWVKLTDTDTDKYGRLLAQVQYGKINLSQWMINGRYAVPYDGGTKTAPSNWKTFHRGGVTQDVESIEDSTVDDVL